MPFLECGDLRVHYAFSGPAKAPVVMLSHSLGTTLGLWEPQMPALESAFRVLRYDTRGHGRTTATPSPYTIEQLGRDAIAVLDALGMDRVHFCGLSLGGMIGIWLGAHARERLDRLVLCNTAARIGTAESWNARIERVRSGGVWKIAPLALERWYTAEFRRSSPDVAAWTLRMLEETTLEGYIGCCAAVRDADLREDLSEIAAPTLVIAGAQDLVTSAADARFLVNRISGACYAELPAAHLSNVEASAEFTAQLTGFLTA